MPQVTEYALQLCFGILGAGLLLVRWALFEQEERWVRTALETAWIRVDDWKAWALSRSAAFVSVSMQLATRVLNRFFGELLFSGRAYGVSFCLGLGTGLIRTTL